MILPLLAAVAIVGGTVHTGRGPAQEGATVLIDANRVAAVGRDVRIPAGAERIDATGMVVTPGLIEPHARLGVTEISANVPSSIEATAGPDYDPVRAALRVFDTFDARSATIPVARGGGLTSAVVVPAGGVIEGQSIWVDLIEDRPVRKRALALHVSLLGEGEGPGARSRAFLIVREAFEDARLYRANRGPYISGNLRKLAVSAADLDALERALEGELRVAIEVDHASDIQGALRLVREHRLDAVLVGAREAWLVADEIAAAGVPVLIDPFANLPYGYESLESRADNAALLHRAGVRIGFTTRADPHLAHRLRFAAGNAVAEGLPYEAAISAITRVPAEIFGVADAGSLRPGMLANVILWNGDPLEVTTWPVRMWIRGETVPLRSRQDLLIERYR